MTFTLEPVCVGNGSDEEGLLVFTSKRRLVAVLSHLGNQYGNVSGHWYLEAGFGRLNNFDHPTFADLEVAKAWINRRLADQP